MYQLFVEQLLPAAIKADISINDFWDLSLDEILLLLKTYKDKQEIRAKEVKAELYTSASMVATFVSRALAGKQIPSIGEIFDDFKEEANQVALMQLKNQLIKFAEMHNQRGK